MRQSLGIIAMDRKELVDYTKQYMAYERSNAAKLAWEALKRNGRESARSIISEFYEEAKKSAKEDHRASSVRNVAEDYNVAIVSAIRTYGNLGPFRPLNRDDFKGVRLFDILLRPDQIACCSTVEKGDSEANLYGSWGVILGEGKIYQAFPYDATTSVDKGEIYSKFSARISGIRPAEQMRQAIRSRRVYNEINASIAGVAGMFYCVDCDDGAQNDFPSKSFRDLIVPLNIPQYLLRQGEFYQIAEVEDISKRSIGEIVSPSEIVQTSIRPTQEQRDHMVEYLIDNLTLAPRNSISSGFDRGQFSYEDLPPEKSARFFCEGEKLLHPSNSIGLRLYGAMALHAFAEAAIRDGHSSISEYARSLAGQVIDLEKYEEYKGRILPNGNLSVTNADLRHYLDTEDLPPYLQDH